MLLVFGAPCQHLTLAGLEHGRTIPLADLGRIEIPHCGKPLHSGLLRVHYRTLRHSPAFRCTLYLVMMMVDLWDVRRITRARFNALLSMFALACRPCWVILPIPPRRHTRQHQVDLAPRFVRGHFLLGVLGVESGAPASEAT